MKDVATNGSEVDFGCENLHWKAEKAELQQSREDAKVPYVEGKFCQSIWKCKS